MHRRRPRATESGSSGGNTTSVRNNEFFSERPVVSPLGQPHADPCTATSRPWHSGLMSTPATPVGSMHVVESTPQTVRSGYLDPAAEPVAVIQPGDTVRYPNTWTHWGNEAKYGMSFADREPLRHRYPNGPYSMLGPVEVTGAEPGDVIEVSITALRTIGWGWNSFPLGVGALPHDFAEPYLHYFRFDDARTTAEYVHGITLPMAPF